MMKHIILVLSLSFLFSQDDTTFVRDYYKYDLKHYQSLELELDFGLGELKIRAHDKPKTVTGTIQYRSSRTKPDVEFSSNGENAILKVKENSDYNFECCENGIDFNNFSFGDDFHNAMDFQLAMDIPTELELNFGLGEADIDITGLSLSYFEFDCGLSDVKLKMDGTNKITCERVSISCGLGDFNGYGLGNLNTRKFSLDVGLGAAMIDLRGKFDEDMDLSIDVGLGALELILPKNVNINLRVDHSFLSSVDVDGLMSKGNNKYESFDWDENRPTIIGDISVGIGAVDVKVD